MVDGRLVSILTLGCKLNLADSGAIGRALAASGLRVTEHLCEADAVVVNTCTVTSTADRKSRKLVRAARRLSPQAMIAVTGCFPESAGEELVLSLGADIIAGTGKTNRDLVVGRLVEHLSGSHRAEDARRSQSTPSAGERVFVEAQSGCNDVCAFCIIPRTRGRERSRPPAEISEEINTAAASGAQEAVITGTQLGAWGRDSGSDSGGPEGLVSHLLENTEIARLRFSSLQPQDITPALLGLWNDPRLQPHFHLALQSGSDRILGAMRRRYSARDFRLAAARIHAALPDAAITTDVIAGFPGETDSDFDGTIALCREVGFARIHAFPFSPRRGTLAAAMAEEVEQAKKRERIAALLELGAELGTRFRARFLGTERPVLWEARREPHASSERGDVRGYTDNYIRVSSAAPAGLAGKITPARLVAAQGELTLAEPLPA
ncbi:MAG: MiaB/RimO family radical SAM methylthiotransferase [Dehalococcoidia bacterium]